MFEKNGKVTRSFRFKSSTKIIDDLGIWLRSYWQEVKREGSKNSFIDKIEEGWGRSVRDDKSVVRVTITFKSEIQMNEFMKHFGNEFDEVLKEKWPELEYEEIHEYTDDVTKSYIL